jgi:hypothetical protein
MESKIEELVYNGQSYLNGNGGSGRSIYIIKSYDSITPTDYNVFSAKAVDEQRLKDKGRHRQGYYHLGEDSETFKWIACR